MAALFLYAENPPLGGGVRKAESYRDISKTPFDLLTNPCGLATAGGKSKGGHNG